MTTQNKMFRNDTKRGDRNVSLFCLVLQCSGERNRHGLYSFLMNILAIGDIVGQPGRRAVEMWLPALKAQYSIDFCFANAENASGGLGLDEKCARQLLDAGLDALTLGNHAFAKKQVIELLEADWPILRPINGPSDWPGKPYLVHAGKLPIVLINLSGSVFMDSLDDPFQAIDQWLKSIAEQKLGKCVIIDFHAEATAEKTAIGHFLKDRVSAVLGTHTHVQTADERILGQGTAYITDLGMTGPSNSVIGMNIESSLRRFTKRLPSRYEIGDGPAVLQGAVITLDPLCGQARSISRVSLQEDTTV